MSTPTTRLLLPLFLFASMLGACGERPRRQESAELSWFALGGDRHDLRGARTAQSEVLRLGMYPRWFVGPPELVSDAEIARRRAAQGIVVQEARSEVGEGVPPGMRWIATVPDRPRTITAIPTSQAGSRLELVVRPGESDLELVLALTLHAGERALWRETEHRSTNVLPFLFALEVGGRPVRLESQGSAHMGGSADFDRLVEPGASRTWNIRVDVASLRAQRGPAASGSVSLVALFSERQHTGWAADRGEHGIPDTSRELPFTGDPVLIRSERAAVPPRP